MKRTWQEYIWLRRLRISRMRAAFIATRKSWYQWQARRARESRRLIGDQDYNGNRARQDKGPG